MEQATNSSDRSVLTFLHLSDIHFSEFEGEREHDLEEKVRELMLEDIAEMHSRVGDMDAILLVGDIASTGAESEYDVAAAFLDRTCELIRCPKNRVVCVPGNHDIDRRKHDAVHAAVREHLRRLPPEQVSDRLWKLLTEPRGADVLLAPLAAYNQFALRYGCAIDQDHLTWAPKSFLLETRKLLVYGATSAWICDPRDDNAHDEQKLILGEFQCAQIAGSRDQIAIAMVHHPSGWLRDAVKVEPWMNRAHIILTGHEHETGITPDAAQQRITIASGAVNPVRTQSGWIPAYNVLKLQLVGADKDELGVEIHVRCWRGDVAEFGPDPRFSDPYPMTIRLRPPAVEGESLPEPPEAPAPLPPEPIDSEARAAVFRVMRATPDARHRAARELGLIGDTDVGGLALDRIILVAALESGKLEQLAERIGHE